MFGNIPQIFMNLLNGLLDLISKLLGRRDRSYFSDSSTVLILIMLC